jgi:hypothetical protein
MASKSSHTIKQRDKPNDVFITPLKLAKTAIDMIGNYDGIWLDPFKATGSYFNQFPTDNKEWCEITDEKDFFEYTEEVDVICSNPPYSLMDKVLDHSIKLNPKVINYLIGINNLTAKRIEKLNNNGYFLTKIHMCKVFKWYGMSVIIQFEKNENKFNIISFDRTVWRND